MEILHSIWDTDNFHLWAENTHLLERNNQEENKNINVLEKKHPYTVNFSRLLELLKIMSTNPDENLAFRPNWLAMNLPTITNNPIISVSKISEELKNEKDLDFNYWQVNTLNLDLYDALDFLLSLPETPPKGVVFSDSLKFWTEVARFSLEIISINSYFPATKVINQDSEKTVFTGIWEAIIPNRTLQSFNLLVKSMPYYCLSFFSKNLTSQDIVLTFINKTIDSFLRKKLSIHLPRRRNEESERINELLEAWFESLFNPTQVELECSTKDFAYFNGIINSWQKNIFREIPETYFRTCFKLVPPDPDKGERTWRVEFYLQNQDDISIIIPADDVWKSKAGTISYLQEKFEDPQERLLKDLAEASTIFPKISESLETTFPSKVQLDDREALEFLEVYSVQLEDNDFGVFLPSWWKNPNNRLGVTLDLGEEGSTANKSYSLFTYNSLIDFNWQFVIDEMKITLEEFEKLSELKVPFVQLRGKWIKLDQEELTEAVEFFREYYNNLRMNDILQLELENEDFLARKKFDLTVKGDFNDRIQRVIEKSRIENLNAPDNFVGTLRSYQEKGYSWLRYLKQYGFGACLADDMGLGKTIQVIAYLLQEKNEKPTNTPALIICPTSILGNWFREIQRFAPSLTTLIHHGSKRILDERFVGNASNYDLIITTYNLAQRDFDVLAQVNWSTIVIDEAQNIKNPSTKQSRKIKKLNGDYRIALTGTPIENRLTELWSILDLLNPGYLGSLRKFKEIYVTPIETKQNTQSIKQLARLVQPFILRRLKTDPTIIRDLPEKTEFKVYCSMTEEQCVLYEAVVKDLIKRLNGLEGISRKGLILAALTKLKQICNHPVQFMHESTLDLKDRSGKLDRLIEMLTEVMANNEKALIFTQYAELGQLLKDYLQVVLDQEVLLLFGGTPQKEREEFIKRFQSTEDGSPKVFILSIKAGGVGLNLTAANHVFHFDRWWNPSVENQATDRAFRIGQKKNVFVHKFISVGTLEENIDRLIEQKKVLADSVIGTGESWLTEMSTEQLREILSLRKLTMGGN
ncbi:MAG: DEAD/DEAH box helicase [Candidatus Heimdallarchaeota archaeon]|nr:DEAD/DEAH box helicase [Candidatus Heimdallarchaeota archaeon]MBY8994504.1 DEAD/DEAH box helicase [Candidatus Heimdallarchaeota archaeon]